MKIEINLMTIIISLFTNICIKKSPYMNFIIKKIIIKLNKLLKHIMPIQIICMRLF